jgi:hypothetical protein
MVVSFWSYFTILKVCCCVSMLLPVILNDCVTFFVDLELLLTKIDLFLFLPSCRHCCFCCCFNRVRVIWSLSFQSQAFFFDWNNSADGIVDCDCFLILWMEMFLFGLESSAWLIFSFVELPLPLLRFIVALHYSFIRRFFCIRPWDCFLLLLNRPLMFPPLCCFNLNSYSVFRAFVWASILFI